MMVAALADWRIRPAPSLLFEPDPLIFDTWRGRWDGRRKGWRILGGDVVRWHDDDAWGAVVQEIVVRYVLHGVARQQLAREYPISERQIQCYVSGPRGRDHGYQNYTEPVRRALIRLGFSPGRRTMAKRMQSAQAIGRLAADLLLLLDKDARPAAREIQASLRLLAEVRHDGR